MKKWIGNAVATVTVVISSLIFSVPAIADDVAEFYKGKGLKLVIGYAPGGGFDRGGRVVGRHIGKHIPGNPTIVVLNMPGAGSLHSLNWIYNKGEKDGSVFGHFHIAAMREAYVGTAAAKFDPRKFYWLGSYTAGSSVLFVRSDSGVNSIQDAKNKQVIIGAVSLRSGAGQYPLILNNLLGTKFKVVTGYSNTGEAMLAMERGEISGYGAWAWTQLRGVQAKWFEDKFVNVLALLAIARRADLPGVPTAVELAGNDDDKRVMKALLVWESLGRSFVAPPGTEPTRGTALRNAFEAMVATPGFKKEIEAESFDVSPVLGAEAHQLLDEVYGYPKEIGDRARKIFTELDGMEKGKATKPK